jgi:hypothetical protein
MCPPLCGGRASHEAVDVAGGSVVATASSARCRSRISEVRLLLIAVVKGQGVSRHHKKYHQQPCREPLCLQHMTSTGLIVLQREGGREGEREKWLGSLPALSSEAKTLKPCSGTVMPSTTLVRRAKTLRPVGGQRVSVAGLFGCAKGICQPPVRQPCLTSAGKEPANQGGGGGEGRRRNPRKGRSGKFARSIKLAPVILASSSGRLVVCCWLGGGCQGVAKCWAIHSRFSSESRQTKT